MPKPPVRSKPAENSGGESSDDVGPAAFSGGDIGVHLAVCVCVGGALGYGLDRWLGWAPWSMIVGGCMGFCAWLLTVWRVIQKA